MSNPDRTLLDQINDAWDDRNQGKYAQSADVAVEFVEMIDTLHRADTGRQPSNAFRTRLREQLLSDSSPSTTPEGEFSFTAEESQVPARPSTRERNGETEGTSRSWWFSHIGELAAIVLILVVAAVGAALWQSGDDGMLPGATSDDSSDQPEMASTPEPIENGIWAELSFEEAQLVTPFNLLMPEHIPEGYELDQIHVRDLSALAEAEDHVFVPQEDGDHWFTAVFMFASSDDELDRIELYQQNLQFPGFREAMYAELDESGEHPRPDTGVDRRALAIDAVEVIQITLQEVDGQHRQQYHWFQDGLTMGLTVPSDGRALEDEVTQMIESLVLQRADESEPPIAEGFGTPFDEDEHTVEAEVDGSAQPELHSGISFEEAQEITPYDLVDPRESHPDYDVIDITVSAREATDYFHTSFTMTHRDEETRTFLIMQQNMRTGIPGIDDHPWDDNDETLETPDPVQEEVEIDGVPVTRTVQYDRNGDQSTSFIWYQNATGVSVYAVSEIHEENINALPPERAVPMDDLDEIVAYLIERRTSDEEPPESIGVPAPDRDDDPVAQSGQSPVPDGNATTVPVSEAVAHAPFNLVDIDHLPVNAEDGVAEFARYEQGSPVDSDHPDADDPNRVTLFFVSPLDHEPEYTLEVVQTTDMIPMPDGGTLEVTGHPVEFVVLRQTPNLLVAGWVWDVNEIEYGVLVTVTDPGSLESTDEIREVLPLSEDDIAPIVESALP
jgi:hypothetical protein